MYKVRFIFPAFNYSIQFIIYIRYSIFNTQMWHFSKDLFSFSTILFLISLFESFESNCHENIIVKRNSCMFRRRNGIVIFIFVTIKIQIKIICRKHVQQVPIIKSFRKKCYLNQWCHISALLKTWLQKENFVQVAHDNTFTNIFTKYFSKVLTILR